MNPETLETAVRVAVFVVWLVGGCGAMLWRMNRP